MNDEAQNPAAAQDAKRPSDSGYNALLAWIDSEIGYHERMLERIGDADDEGSKLDFSEHNMGHLHLTRLRDMVKLNMEREKFVGSLPTRYPPMAPPKQKGLT